MEINDILKKYLSEEDIKWFLSLGDTSWKRNDTIKDWKTKTYKEGYSCEDEKRLKNIDEIFRYCERARDNYLHFKKSGSPFLNTRYESASLSNIEFDEIDSEKLSKWLNNTKDILFIHSPPGVGKTYFCAAVVNYFAEHYNKYFTYYRERDLFKELKEKIQCGEGEEYLLNKIRKSEYLIIDDLGATRSGMSELGLTDWQKDVLFDILDYRVVRRLPTIYSSNYSINELSSIFHERFKSRMASKENVILELKGLDKRQ